MKVKPVKAHEAEHWIEKEMMNRLAVIPCIEHDDELFNQIRKEVTKQYYSTKPEGLVMIQLTIDRVLREATDRREAAFEYLRTA